jgi:Mg-chelatase subunit ChlD
MVMLVALLALALDLGFMYNVRTDMQCAADAGALAGAGELPNGQQAAQTAARDFVVRNATMNSSVAASDIATTVEIGNWDSPSRSFSINQAPLNAVRVVGQRNNAPLFFANAFNRSKFDMQASAVATYQPRDIMLVLDYSGSMNNFNKIGALKDAVAVFINVLQQQQSDDRVGLSVYSTNGSLARGLTFNLSQVLSDVQSRSAGGWTNMGEGMELGRTELINNARAGTKKLMVVMTDGIANRPFNTTFAKRYVRNEAGAAANASIPIVAISFSGQSDGQLMGEIATITQGVHYHVAGSVQQQEAELKRVFREVAAKRPLLLVE